MKYEVVEQLDILRRYVFTVGDDWCDGVVEFADCLNIDEFWEHGHEVHDDVIDSEMLSIRKLETDGITDIRDLDSSGFEGALITNELKSEGVILVKRGNRPRRRRFTVGHEVGHFLNFWHKPPQGGFYCSKQDMLATPDGGTAHSKMESEANEFSAEMLMPEPLFRRDLKKKASPGLEHIIGWSDRYETSKLATARRFVDLSDTPSAIVLSKDGVVEFSYRKKNVFPFIDLKSGQSMPKKSLTQRFSGTGDGCSNTDETEPSFWISSKLRRGTTMYEQVLVQRKGYRITLLTIDEDEAEDDEDEYVREQSERQPSFR